MGGRGASRASLTDSLHLFEVSERSERCELCNAPMDRAPQVARSAAEGRGDRGRLLFGYFLLAKQEKVTALPGAIPAPLRESGAALRRSFPAVRRSNLDRCRSTPTLRNSTASFRWREACLKVRGFAPADDSLFLLSPKKSKQKKATPSCRVPPLRCGQPAVLVAWAHCTTRTTHCVRSARTSAMSQSTKREMLRAAQSTALLGASTGGTPADARAIAALGPGLRAFALLGLGGLG